MAMRRLMTNAVRQRRFVGQRQVGFQEGRRNGSLKPLTGSKAASAWRIGVADRRDTAVAQFKNWFTDDGAFKFVMSQMKPASRLDTP